MGVAVSENKRRMLAGELYDPLDPALVAEHHAGQAILSRYNSSPADDPAARAAMLADLLGAVGEGVTIRPPFQCDYGGNIRIGARTFVNFGAVFLDCAAIVVGVEAFLAPNVQLYAATHPIDPVPRRAGEEYAYPITIGDGAWIGGGTIVCPGVTIGENSVIGAGSVVTRDVPANVVAAGNPARILRAIVPGEPMRRPFAPPPPPR